MGLREPSAQKTVTVLWEPALACSSEITFKSSYFAEVPGRGRFRLEDDGFTWLQVLTDSNYRMKTSCCPTLSFFYKEKETNHGSKTTRSTRKYSTNECAPSFEKHHLYCRG